MRLLWSRNDSPLGFPDETRFSVIPEVIFEGDTVTLVCENDVSSSNVSWHHVQRGADIQNSSRFWVYTTVLNNMTSVSRLTVYNITQRDAGGCPPRNWWEGRSGEPRKKQTIEHLYSVCIFKYKSLDSTFPN